MLIRAPDATHVYTGIDLARLSGARKALGRGRPPAISRASARACPEFYAGDLFCPVGKTPLYLGQPVALLIFETVRRLRSGAACAARWRFREIRRGNRPRRRCPTTAPFASRASPAPTPDAPDVYSPVQEGWVSPGTRPEHGASDLGAACAADQGAPTPRPRPTASRSAPSLPPTIRPAGARPRIRDPVRRSDVSRARMRSRLVRRRPQEPRARARRAVAVRGRGVRSRSCWAKPARPSSRRASTRSSPISAAASADATTRRFRSTSRWRRCSFPAARFGSPTIAISSSRAASSGTRSRCARGSASIGRPARSAHSPPTMCWMAAASPIIRPTWRRSPPTAAIGIYDVPKVDVTTVALHSRGVTAGSMRGYGTLQTMTALEVLIDEAAAGAAARSDRVPPAQRAQDRRPDHDGKSVHRLGPHAGDPRQARAASDLAAARRREGARPASGHARRHRRGLRHQGLRHRSGLFAGHGGDRPGWPHRHPLRSRRDGQRHRDGARQPRRAPSGRRRRRSRRRADRRLRRARARHLRRSLHDGPGDAGRRAARSALGAGDQLGHDRLDRRPCRNACGGRGGARHLPLRAVAGGARIVAHRADRSEGEAMGGGALAGRAADHAGLGAAGAARASPRGRMRATA